MNNSRRKQLQQAVAYLKEMSPLLDNVRAIIDQAADEEREYYDNMPESLKSGDKGTNADDAASALEEVRGELEGFDLDYIITSIDDVLSL